MEEIKHYYMNLNYEDELYELKTKKDVLRTLEDLSFIFFLLCDEECIFITQNEYSKDYMKKLKGLGLHPCVTLTSSDKACPWWGDFSSIELKKRFNSKSWFVDLLISLNIETTQSLIKNNLEKFKNTEIGPVLIKSPFGMSGKRTLLLKKNESINTSSLPGNDLVLSPVLDKVIEFSVVIVSYKRVEINVSEYSSAGVFQGGLSFYDHEVLLHYLAKHYHSYSLESWKEVLVQIKEDIKHILDEMSLLSVDNLSFPFAVDVLIHSKNTNLKIEYLELNYRKSMGLLLVKLKSMLHENCIGKLSITKKVNSKKTCLELSPENSKIKLYFDLNWPGA